MSRIKVVQVTYVLKSGAGVEQLVCQLASKFNNASFETFVVGFKNGSLRSTLEKKGIPVMSVGKRAKLDASFVARFRRTLAVIQPDIIHSHTFSPNFWSVLLGKQCSGSATVSTVHTLIQDRLIYIPIYRFVNAFSDRLVAVSQKVKDNYVQLCGVPADKVQVIYNGVERTNGLLSREEMKKLREELGLNHAFKTIICVGRLEDPKGHKYLIHAAHRLAARGIKANFLVVGEGYLKEELINLARRLGVHDQFFFAGYRPDVPDLLQIADMAVVSSVREGFSVALVEFMAAGLPLVVTDVGGNSEALSDGVSGIIVSPGDPEALEWGIERVLGERQLAENMGIAAQRAYEQRFTMTHMINEYERLYYHLVNTSKERHQS